MQADTQLNNYLLEARIGEGGMAEVWRARHVHLDRHVAIKIMAKHLMGDPKFEARFLLEAKAMARLQHPHIVGATDFFIEQGAYCLVMPYLDGGSVGDALDQSRGPLPLEQALSIARQILSALDHAHQHGVIHRDVKPSNILLDRSGTAFLADFGIALLMGEDRKTRTGTAIGTPHYMSPEQIMRPKTMDHRSDVYSFGCVLFEMLTGRLPFDATEDEGDTDLLVKTAHLQSAPPSPRGLNPRLPLGLEVALLKALAKDPANRFSGCGEFAESLGGATLQQPKLTPPLRVPPPQPPLPQPIRVEEEKPGYVRHRLRIAGVGMILFGAIDSILFYKFNIGFAKYLTIPIGCITIGTGISSFIKNNEWRKFAKFCVVVAPLLMISILTAFVISEFKYKDFGLLMFIDSTLGLSFLGLSCLVWSEECPPRRFWTGMALAGLLLLVSMIFLGFTLLRLR